MLDITLITSNNCKILYKIPLVCSKGLNLLKEPVFHESYGKFVLSSYYRRYLVAVKN